MAANSTLDDFARGIGRLAEARGNVIEALFDPQSLPDLLTELEVSDANRSVTAHVMQRLSGGIVRGVGSSPVDSVPRGATIINSRHHTATPIDSDAFARVVAHFADPHDGSGELLETGIKVIDVMCPLVAGGTVAIAGEIAAGGMTIMEELVRRLSRGTHRISLFLLLPQWEAERAANFSHADALHKKGFSEGTVGVMQTFFFRAADGPWNVDRLDQFASVDTISHVSRDMAAMNIYPCVDPRTSRSRLLNSQAIGDDHATIAERARRALVLLMNPELATTTDVSELGRARKLANFFAQPFYCAEPWTKRPGAYVSRKDSLITCAAILDGR